LIRATNIYKAMNTESEDQSVQSYADLEETKDDEDFDQFSEDDESMKFLGYDEETKIVSKVKFVKYNP
jgi:hypothetical protein